MEIFFYFDEGMTVDRTMTKTEISELRLGLKQSNKHKLKENSILDMNANNAQGWILWSNLKIAAYRPNRTSFSPKPEYQEKNGEMSIFLTLGVSFIMEVRVCVNMARFHSTEGLHSESGASAGLIKFLYGCCMQYREELFQDYLRRQNISSIVSWKKRQDVRTDQRPPCCT